MTDNTCILERCIMTQTASSDCRPSPTHSPGPRCVVGGQAGHGKPRRGDRKPNKARTKRGQGGRISPPWTPNSPSLPYSRAASSASTSEVEAQPQRGLVEGLLHHVVGTRRVGSAAAAGGLLALGLGRGGRPVARRSGLRKRTARQSRRWRRRRGGCGGHSRTRGGHLAGFCRPTARVVLGKALPPEARAV